MAKFNDLPYLDQITYCLSMADHWRRKAQDLKDAGHSPRETKEEVRSRRPKTVDEFIVALEAE